MEKRILGNKYEIIEKLGRGGMAEVFRSHHINLDRYVAIKILHDFLADDSEFKSRFEKEARNIARLKHPNIVQVYDFEYDEASESYYMVMELVTGTNLKDKLKEFHERDEHFPLAEALRITREAASALSYAHKTGMIHRDVKPANLILDDNEDYRIVLTDFGISKMITTAQMTITGGIIGTPAYMAPEQGVGETGDERSDLYSLGVILYQMVTGQLPFDADTPLALILKHLNDPIPKASEINKALPAAIDDIINRLMAKEPGDRYQNAEALIEDVFALEQQLPDNEAISLPIPKDPLDSRSTSDDLSVGLVELSDDPATLPLKRMDTPAKRSSQSTDRLQQTKEITKGPEQKSPGRNSRLIWFGGIMGAIIIGIGGYVFGATNGTLPSISIALSASDTPTATLTETMTPSPTLTETDTRTLTSTPTETSTLSDTPTSTITSTPSQTPTETPAVTPSDTPDVTATLAVQRTATFAACDFDYAIIEQVPEDGEDGGFNPINTAYTRTITFLNSGTCAWERNTSLTFVNGSGESFDAGPRVFIREPVEVGEEVEVLFEGRLPSRGSQTPYSGTWQLRTPGQIPIGEPFTISVLVFDPGT